MQKWPKSQKTFFSNVYNFFKNGDKNTWGLSKCPLNPVDASTYRQIYCTIRIGPYFQFLVMGGKKAVFSPPQSVFVPFRQYPFELRKFLFKKKEQKM